MLTGAPIRARSTLLLASITQNPALELFVDVLNRVAMMYSMDWQTPGPAVPPNQAPPNQSVRTPDQPERTPALPRRLSPVIPASPGDGCACTWRPKGTSCAAAARSGTCCPISVVVLSESGGGKRAEAVARRITQEIVGGGMQPGALVGAEKDLIEQEGVSRAVCARRYGCSSTTRSRGCGADQAAACSSSSRAPARSQRSRRSTWPGAGCGWQTWRAAHRC